MVIRITWSKLRAGAWDEFERTYQANVITKGKNIKGLRAVGWLRTRDKDTGFAVSLWDNLSDRQSAPSTVLRR